jgi:electron transfer flavoprotein alpha subunit
MPNSSQETKRILVVVEKEDGEVAGITFELLQMGRSLAGSLGGILCAAVLGHRTGTIAEKIAPYADEVYCIDSPLLEIFRSDLYTHLLEKLCRHVSPGIVLMGHTVNNLDLAPRLACRMSAKLVTDCTSIRVDNGTGSLLCTKPVYGDRANAVFVLDGIPKMATLRAKSIEPVREGSGKGEILNLDISADHSFDAVELVETVPGESVTLDKADAIVAGGRGIKDTEGLKILEELIEALKRYFATVELGASRPLVDGGLLPKSRQLGQTGEKAAPQLYVAVAISGSSQHVSGVAGSKKIVAINKDGEAPIFDIADYGVVGQYESVVPALIGKLTELS